jgi:hypothetical protein
MTAGPEDRTANRPGFARPDLLFALAVVCGYAGATIAAFLLSSPHAADRLMLVAERVLAGHFDSDALKGAVDTVQIGDKYYTALGPAQLFAYVPFAAVPALQASGGYIASALFGVAAALSALPLARRYGAKGRDAYWIAAFTAFGSLLWFSSVFGNPYYLAHAESFLALSLFLIEWAGRRRPVALGALVALSFLARPTTILAAVPFGLVLLWRHRADVRAAAATAIAFGLPIAGAIAFFGWYNWARFGSPLESGYAISYLGQPSLEARRSLGVFSIRQVPENLRLALLALPDRTAHFPFLVPSKFGMSMLLVSPALLTSIWAGFRDRTAQLLWIAAALVAVPVFLYYGGGYVQYGFRYSLDFTPFLVALMAIGSRRWIGRPERLLVMVSIASVFVGIVWHAAGL